MIVVDDSELLVALAIRGALLLAAVVNVALSLRMYRRFHDGRAVRSLVTFVGMFGGTVALAATSPVIRDRYPEWMQAYRVLASAGVAVFIIALLFALVTWRLR